MFRSLPFKFEFPVEVFEKATDEPGKSRRIGGIISTEHKDQQDEIVLQRGLDFNYFLKNGWLNDNHSKDTTGVVGYPLDVKRTTYKGKPATYMEGYLLDGYDRSDKIWKLAQSLQKTNRRLGFSVEGKVQQRTGNDGKIVAKALVTNVAVTNCPINDKTNLEVIAKSMRYLENNPTEFEKAMLAGSSVAPAADPVSPGNVGPLIPESLDRDLKVTTYQGVKKKKKKKKKPLTKAQVVNCLIERYPHIGLSKAFQLYDFLTKIRS